MNEQPRHVPYHSVGMQVVMLRIHHKPIGESQTFLILALKVNPNVLECLYSPIV